MGVKVAVAVDGGATVGVGVSLAFECSARDEVVLHGQAAGPELSKRVLGNPVLVREVVRPGRDADGWMDGCMHGWMDGGREGEREKGKEGKKGSRETLKKMRLRREKKVCMCRACWTVNYRSGAL